jgi:hypothetical protein
LFASIIIGLTLLFVSRVLHIKQLKNFVKPEN